MTYHGQPMNLPDLAQGAFISRKGGIKDKIRVEKIAVL